MIDDYLHNFESRRQQGYQDLQRALANDIAGYGGNQRSIMARQLQYGRDLSDFNAEMDRTFDPYGQGKWQAEQARAAYSPESLAPPQAVIDNYAPLRAEMQADAERRKWANESNLANAAMYRTPEPAPIFDSRGELIDRTGIIDFDAARRQALERAATQFRAPSAPPVQSYARPMGSAYPVSVTTEDVAPIVAGGRTRYSGTMADTLEEGAARTPLGGMQSNIGDIVTGRDGKRYRRTAVGYTDNLAPDAIAAQAPSNDDLFRQQQARNAMAQQQRDDYAAQQKALRQARLRGSLVSAGVRNGPYGPINFSYGREPTQAELDYA